MATKKRTLWQFYQKAYDFLVAIAEPMSRPEHIHRYLLTPYSLYAAVATAIDTRTIIDMLDRLCKTEVPQSVKDFIRTSTDTFGKAKLVLKDNKFYVQSAYPDVLRLLLKHPVIAAARVLEEEADPNQTTTDGFTRAAAPKELAANLSFALDDTTQTGGPTGSSMEDEGDDDTDDLDTEQTLSFMVHQDKVQVRQSTVDTFYHLAHLMLITLTFRR